MSDRTLAEVQRRWNEGVGWPPGIHYRDTADADAKFLLAEVERLKDIPEETVFLLSILATAEKVPTKASWAEIKALAQAILDDTIKKVS